MTGDFVLLVEYVRELGEVIASFPTLAQCLEAAAMADYVADGMASYTCEVEV